MYQQPLQPVAGSLALSAACAALPLLTLFLLLGVARTRAWVAAFGALAVAVVLAWALWRMPLAQTLLAAGQGATFAIFPLVWTFGTAIWIYRMTVHTGHFDTLRRGFARISDDRRVQAMVIAFCFGSLLEALAGQGTPVAVTTVMLLALGFTPVRAATVALVANTVPAAFGPLGLPITTLSGVTGLPATELGMMAGRQVPVVAVLVPLVLLLVVDGRRGLRELWRPALACGVAFALAQFATTNFLTAALADIVAAFAGAGVLLLVTRRARRPVPAPAGDGPPERAASSGSAASPAGGAGPAGSPQGPPEGGTSAPGRAWLAYAPYVTIVAVFAVSQVPAVKRLLDAGTLAVSWPGLHVLTAAGAPSPLSTFRFAWLAAPGSLLLVAGLVTMALLRVSPREAGRLYGRTLYELRWAVLTVVGLLALSFTMNASGQIATLGVWMAGAGTLFAVLAPVLGWLGVALTGSDTSSNSLFGALQVAAAQRAGLDPVLLAAANASGGTLGKMISLQNLTIAAAAVGLTGREGDLFRRMFGWSVLLLALMCLLVGLQATPLLSWMVP
ncbi:L-lactate permease [Micromonospora carbonacea]|uniref:L-lactate permease n=1 Tax=Micromonospora carbonacea TaxID=47853 RepID=A0A7H8XKY8_9ACTN|nr:L-lactate permease [Micromonospora carbonacea]MBB5826167.1 lactate permease [Micromonospora carbonacea]QLD25723.1 L-lactate permease [Micromonospora carbonacea]